MTQSRRIRPPSGPSRRRGLAADTLVILAGALLAILASRVLVPDAALTVPSSLPGDSENVIGIASQAPNPTLPALATLGPPVNASAGLNATPTPIPIITLGPPTPSPSVDPNGSVPASARPSAKPTPTPPPKVVASFICKPLPGYLLSCTNQSVNSTSWLWNWGDGTTDTTKNPTPPHQYSATQQPVSVTLTATGPGGSNSQTIFYPLLAPTPTP